MMKQYDTHSRLSRPFFTVVGSIIVAGLIIATFAYSKGQQPPPIPANQQTASTLPKKTSPATTILAFGDSITAGYGISLADAYPAELERLLTARGYNVRVINSGVSGETTAGGLRRAESTLSFKPNIVLVALGGNDVLRGINPTSTKQNLEGIIDIFTKEGIQVIIAGMYAPQNLGESYVQEFNAIYQDLGKEKKITLVPFLLEGVALNRTLNQSDGIHPNVLGAQFIAENNILPVVMSLLSQNRE